MLFWVNFNVTTRKFQVIYMFAFYLLERVELDVLKKSSEPWVLLFFSCLRLEVRWILEFLPWQECRIRY